MLNAVGLWGSGAGLEGRFGVQGLRPHGFKVCGLRFRVYGL